MAYDPNDGLMRNRILKNIDLKTTGNTVLFTIPASFLMLPITNGRLVITESTGTGVGVCTVSVGTNSPNYNNIYAATTPLLGNLAVNGGIDLTPLFGNYTSASGDVYVRVSVAATGFTSLKALLYLPYLLVNQNP